MFQCKNALRVFVLGLFSCMFLMGYGQLSQKKAADLIIFSYHRPMQLYAVLESVQKYFSHLNQIYVLYRTDNAEYEAGYQEIQASFSQVQFVKQGSNPRADFKPLLLQCFFGSPSEYILFGVDDDIVKDYVDIDECIHAMEASDSYGFYLRLGSNIARQYGQDVTLRVPPCVEVQKDIFKFQFKDGIGDWRYPHNVDMTIFKKAEIEHFFRNASYSSPNTLESAWSGVADIYKYGLFFKNSKMFTLPLNIVQQDWVCSHENSFTAAELLEQWKRRFKMDVDQFYHVNNDCAFMGYIPTFVKR